MRLTKLEPVGDLRMSQQRNRILIVDDEADYVEGLTGILNSEGYEVAAAENFEQTMEKVEAFLPNIVILDLHLELYGGENAGAVILEHLRKRWSKEVLPILIVSGIGNPKRVMDVLKMGADDYLDKPIDPNQLLEKLRGFLNTTPLAVPDKEDIWTDNIVGRSKVINNLAMSVFRAAQAECDILMLGETGNGKTLLADIFHQVGMRNTKPFVRIDLNTIPGNLFETTIFGYVKNAFTGATTDRAGAAEEAQGGILFLDEIGDVPYEQQGKLLTLVESKTITRVGSSDPIHLDVLIIMATHRNLRLLVEQKKFRHDLYYRLMNTVIEVPPLKDHLEDLPDLVKHFIKKFNPKYGKNISYVTPDVLDVLRSSEWGGNVRQLKNTVEEGVRNAVGTHIDLKDIQTYLNRDNSKLPSSSELDVDGGTVAWDVDYKTFKKQVLWNLEREYLRRKLDAHAWNAIKTAKAMGMAQYQYLHELMRRFELKREA